MFEDSQLLFDFMSEFPSLVIKAAPALVTFIISGAELKDSFERSIRGYCMSICSSSSCKDCNLSEFRLLIARLGPMEFYEFWTGKSHAIPFLNKDFEITAELERVMAAVSHKSFIIVEDVAEMLKKLSK